MKATNATLISHFEQECTTVAGLWKITREDSTVLGFTDHPFDLVYDGVTYNAASGFSRTAITDKEGLSVDNLDLLGLFDSSLITADDIRKGKYRGASVTYAEVNYQDDPIVNLHKLEYGYIGEITLHDNMFVAEFRSLFQLLDQEIGDRYGRYCRVKLGSSECGVTLEPDDWAASTVYAVGDEVKATSYDGRRYVCTTAGTSHSSEPTWDTTIGNTTTETGGVAWLCYTSWTKVGEVDSVASKAQFTDATLTEANDWYRYGILTWTSGDNNGLSVDVKQSTSSGVITLKFSMPYTIAVGDDFTITVGCNHLLKADGDEWGSTYTGDCIAVFNNATNFRGECEIPSNDIILAGSQ